MGLILYFFVDFARFTVLSAYELNSGLMLEFGSYQHYRRTGSDIAKIKISHTSAAELRVLFISMLG